VCQEKKRFLIEQKYSYGNKWKVEQENLIMNTSMSKEDKE
jgi:hypothetical protein